MEIPTSVKEQNVEKYRELYARCHELLEVAKSNQEERPELFQPEERNGLKVLDLFCCSGGVSYGLWMAGFDVVGIDINEKHLANHPHEEGMTVICGDVSEYLTKDFISEFDLIWASPPCQGFSGLNEANKCNFKKGTLKRQEKDRSLFFDVQEFLENCGKPYILENVGGTRKHMKNPIMICGLDMGLLTFRHRFFQTNMPLHGSSTDKEHRGKHRDHKVISHEKLDGTVFSIVGHSGKRNFWNKEVGQVVMGMPWDITSLALREAIPPCYAKFLGMQVVEHLT
jgi:DNA (cytosine-5)-methyltransferase 1